MRPNACRMTIALAISLLLTTTLVAQEPRRGGEGGRGGRGGQGPRRGLDDGPGREGAGSIERFADGIKASDTDRDTVREATRSYQGAIRSQSDQAETKLMAKLKKTLGAEEYIGIQQATRGPIADGTRTGRRNGPGNRGQAGRGGRPEAREATGFSLGQIERAAGDLKLSESKKEAVDSAIKDAREDARKQTEKARADLTSKVSTILNQEDMARFKTTLEQASTVGEQPRRAAERGRPGPPRR